jgi:hypothetical protein
VTAESFCFTGRRGAAINRARAAAPSIAVEQSPLSKCAAFPKDMGIGRRKVLRRRAAPDDDPRLGKRALSCAKRIAILAIVRS